MQPPYLSLGYSQSVDKIAGIYSLFTSLPGFLSALESGSQLRALKSSCNLCQFFSTGSNSIFGILCIKHMLTHAVSFMNHIGLSLHFLDNFVSYFRFHVEIVSISIDVCFPFPSLILFLWILHQKKTT